MHYQPSSCLRYLRQRSCHPSLSSGETIHFLTILSSNIHIFFSSFPLLKCIPLEVHSNMDLPSPPKVHSNMNPPFPLLKCIPLGVHSNVDPPSPMLQHTPPEAYSNVDLSSFSQSLKCEFNGKIKSQSGQVCPNMSLSFIPSSSNPLSSSPVNVLHTVSIAELLKQYPKHRFVDTITMIVASGVRVGFEGSNLGQTRRPNLASAF